MREPRLHRVTAIVGLAAAWAAGAHAQPPEPAAPAPGFFDPVTGRDLSNFPPDPRVEYRHMRLELDIADMNTPRLDAVQTLTIAPIAYPLAELTLDARLLLVNSVRVPGAPAVASAFEADGERLVIRFDPALEPGVARDIVTSYMVDDPPLGLVWTPEHTAWPGRAAQIHTQGQAEDNSYWFPCHDFPNVRMTTEVIATVPDGFIVSSNGRLVSEDRESRLVGGRGGGANGAVIAVPSGDDRRRFHWLQDKPHAPYLVSLVVGKFDVIDVGPRRLPMPVYVPPGTGRDVERTYGRTPAMVEHFARLFDEPYPWDRYAQLVVWNFAAGGMENTSATTLYDTAILDAEGLADGDLDNLISHELAHQWFGDLITCRSWEHLWLNEGFATYCEALWAERRGGREHGFEAYQAQIIEDIAAVTRIDTGAAPYQPAMVCREYGHPDEVFGRASDPYSKGSAVLHMLRERLGDDVFFKAMGLYIDRHRMGLVETDDFRKVLEEVSGESLEQFFAHWCERPGVPRLEVGLEWSEPAHQLLVTVRQTQPIDGYNPAFEFELPVWVRVGGRGGVERHRVPVDAKEVSRALTLTGAPSMAAVDPELEVLASMTIAQPSAWLVEQLLRGPTLAARVQAARGLASDTAADASMALWAVFADERQHRLLRSEAIRSLAKRPGATWLDDLTEARVRDNRVRAAAVEAVADAASAPEPYPTVVVKGKRYLARAAMDPSGAVRAAAVRGLGRVKDGDHLPLLLGALEQESQDDKVRRAALEALADLDQPDGLPAAAHYVRPGVLSDTRTVAVHAVGRLARHDPAAALDVLTGVLDDRERNVWQAAGEVLASLGNPRVVPHLERRLERARAEIDRAMIRGWIGALKGAPDPG